MNKYKIACKRHDKVIVGCSDCKWRLDLWRRLNTLDEKLERMDELIERHNER